LACYSAEQGNATVGLFQFRDIRQASIMNTNRAIFIDRDGVINHDYGYVFKWSDFKFIAGSIDAMRLLYNNGFLLFIITNQSGISREFYSESDLSALNEDMCAFLSKYGVKIQQIYYCPHMPEDKCICRKPSPELILRAQKDHRVDLRQSYMIGDKMSDIEAGLNAGVGSQILIDQSDRYASQPSSTFSIAKSLYEAAKTILKERTELS
jgi:D-glycero-D-manno-heptose 1,7-bisphosphate phosphatase